MCTALDPSRKIRTGTCAWSYEDWKGGFYPVGLPPGERLAYYATHFDAVEVDSTFYHAPTQKMTRHWAEITPEGFVFACKMPRGITHERRLRDCDEAVEHLLQGLDPLGEKLACVLIQLPPSFRLKHDEAALRQFLKQLPRSVRFAVEFRHHEWHLPRIAEQLEENRVCWAWTDVTSAETQMEGAFEFLPRTADFGYVRFLGDIEDKYDADGERKYSYHELAWPRDVALENWVTRLKHEAEDLSSCLTFCANHFEGFGPGTAQRVSALLGKPTHLFAQAEPPDDGGQMTLL